MQSKAILAGATRSTFFRVVLVSICLTPVSINAQSNPPWFHKRVVWKAAPEPRVWETPVASPNGREHYKLALIPLWALEGGIVGAEILVARPEHPDDNLLGQPENDTPQPFVLTVEELETGIKKSKFGTTRTFKLDKAKLLVKIRGARLGKGVGECPECKNIQELIVEFVFGN